MFFREKSISRNFSCCCDVFLRYGCEKIYDESRVLFFFKVGFEALFDDGDNTLREEDFWKKFEFLRDFFRIFRRRRDERPFGGDLATAGQFWPKKEIKIGLISN